MSILKRGMSGAPVKRLQKKLDIDADGIFGPGTENAVKAFQEANGISAMASRFLTHSWRWVSKNWFCCAEEREVQP